MAVFVLPFHSAVRAVLYVLNVLVEEPAVGPREVPVQAAAYLILCRRGDVLLEIGPVCSVRFPRRPSWSRE